MITSEILFYVIVSGFFGLIGSFVGMAMQGYFKRSDDGKKR